MNRLMVVLVAGCLSPALVGCASVGWYKITLRDGGVLVPRDSRINAFGCLFEVLSTAPDLRKFEEIGVVEPQLAYAHDATHFREYSAPALCSAGGDAIVPVVNGRGEYIKGVVYKRRER